MTFLPQAGIGLNRKWEISIDGFDQLLIVLCVQAGGRDSDLLVSSESMINVRQAKQRLTAADWLLSTCALG